MTDRNTTSPADPPLLAVRRLCKHFPISGGRLGRASAEVMKAVDHVSFDVRRGETLGIVGESGSGKTTAVRCVLRAINPTAGTATLTNLGRSVDLLRLSSAQFKPVRREMQMIFQDPFASLNPRMTVGDIIAEPLIIHRMGSRAERDERVADMLRSVGLLPEHRNRYPHAFSGGQRQRVGIARALIFRPALVVADEAVSALDVCVRAKVLDLLQSLQEQFNLTYIFVSHDLSVVRNICDRVLVMHRGRVVEAGPTERVFTTPRHAYTRVLLSAIPYPDPDRKLQPLRVNDLTPSELEPLDDVNAGLWSPIIALG